jgi:hypothetical protein
LLHYRLERAPELGVSDEFHCYFYTSTQFPKAKEVVVKGSGKRQRISEGDSTGNREEPSRAEKVPATHFRFGNNTQQANRSANCKRIYQNIDHPQVTNFD